MAKSNPAHASLPFLKFHESLVAHEVAHQIFRSHLGGRTVSLATHEYVAYAMQIASMPLGVRKAFLKPLNSKAPDNLEPFVDVVLFNVSRGLWYFSLRPFFQARQWLPDSEGSYRRQDKLPEFGRVRLMSPSQDSVRT